jgi:hypothetical protein
LIFNVLHFDRLIEIDRVTACAGHCLIALRATAKRQSISAAKRARGAVGRWLVQRYGRYMPYGASLKF